MVIFDQFLYPINLVKPGPNCLFIYPHYTISLQVALSSGAWATGQTLRDFNFPKNYTSNWFLKLGNDARWLADSYASKKRKVCFQNLFGPSFFIFNFSQTEEKNKNQEKKLKKSKWNFWKKLNEGVEKKWISGKLITCLSAIPCCTQMCIYCASCAI